MIDVLQLIRRTPYVFGGREPGKGLDCLGTVLVLAKHAGLPMVDPWQAIGEAWRCGRIDTASGFGAGWRRAEPPVREGDVLLYFEEHPWCAIVCQGFVWSADPRIGGVYCRPLARWSKTPAQVWRYGGACSDSQGSAG